ncbi:uncharacterized protein AAES06_016969 isoform 1-T2 [Glossophaga mutica]
MHQEFVLHLSSLILKQTNLHRPIVIPEAHCSPSDALLVLVLRFRPLPMTNTRHRSIVRSNATARQVLWAHRVARPASRAFSRPDRRLCAALTSAPLSAGAAACSPRHLLTGLRLLPGCGDGHFAASSAARDDGPRSPQSSGWTCFCAFPAVTWVRCTLCIFPMAEGLCPHPLQEGFIRILAVQARGRCLPAGGALQGWFTKLSGGARKSVCSLEHPSCRLCSVPLPLWSGTKQS